jgi:hypothetical protein
MRLPRNFRNLTSDEVTVARQVFAASIPYGQVLISDGLGYDDRPFTVPTSMPVPFFRAVSYDRLPIPGGSPIPGKYVIHAGPACYARMNGWKDGQDTLIHELVHVWQGEHSTWSWSYVIMSGKEQALAGDAAYDYVVDPQHKERLLPWEFYGPEQQAKLVEDWYADGMQAFDPIARTGDKRFYYIKKYIRGEDVDFDWLPEPLEPILHQEVHSRRGRRLRLAARAARAHRARDLEGAAGLQVGRDGRGGGARDPRAAGRRQGRQGHGSAHRPADGALPRAPAGGCA